MNIKNKHIQKVPCLHGDEAQSWNQQFQCKRAHSYYPAKQQHKNEYYKMCYLKPYQTHRHHNAHYRTVHCTSQRIDPAPPDRPQAQNIPIIKPEIQVQSHPQRCFHHKLDSKRCSLQKGDSNHSNLNKMKGDRNTKLVKVHNKNPPKQTKEEIGSFPEKYFRIMKEKITQIL